MQLTRHAADKLETYGITGSRLMDWRLAMDSGIPFLDVSTGARGLLIRWEKRPWIVILREDGTAIVTTYPTDDRTVMSRFGGGRWMSPSS